jgi:photosystem II stability/assembly factor-like uncharacterized protein
MSKRLTFATGIVVMVTIAILLIIAYFDTVTATESWKKLTERHEAHAPPFLSVFFFDSDNGLGLGFSKIARTTDGGKTWLTDFEDEDMQFSSFIFSEKVGWAVGSHKKNPVILKTEDEGHHWAEAEFDSQSLKTIGGKMGKFFDVCKDEAGRLWIAGDGGIVTAREDSLIVAVADFFQTPKSVFGIACDKEGKIWAVEESGSILGFDNGWTERKLVENSFLTRFRVIDDTLWVVGKEGDSKALVLRSRDKGKSWEKIDLPFDSTLFDICLKNQSGWLVGTGGSIYYTDDRGSSWRRLRSPTHSDLLYLFFKDSESVWIAGDRETILRLQK